jgi:hypothetical protein
MASSISPSHRPVTADDAAEIQAAAMAVHPGGIIPKYSFAAAVQSAADRNAKLAEGQEPITLKEVLVNHPPSSKEAEEMERRAIEIFGSIPEDSIIPDIKAAASNFGPELAEKTGEQKYVTKQDAAMMQSEEAHLHGGKVPVGSTAAQLQSAADKNENLRSEMRSLI